MYNLFVLHLGRGRRFVYVSCCFSALVGIVSYVLAIVFAQCDCPRRPTLIRIILALTGLPRPSPDSEELGRSAKNFQIGRTHFCTSW